jgi:glycerophosphoryl diester phosphodiesterase
MTLLTTIFEKSIPMLVISHRGYHVRLPENTLESFKAAIAMGVDGIETDIRLSADQVPILCHDHLTPDGRDVASQSHAEVANAFGHSIPMLEQALQLPTAGKNDFLWNLEIKTPAAVDQTVALVNRYRATRRMLITSFWHPVIADISQRNLDVECGLLVAHRPIGMHVRPDWIPNHPQVKTVVWYWETIDADLIAQSAACGLHNFVYGVTTPEEHARLADWGLDGVITDHPEYLLRRA